MWHKSLFVPLYLFIHSLYLYFKISYAKNNFLSVDSSWGLFSIVISAVILLIFFIIFFHSISLFLYSCWTIHSQTFLLFDKMTYNLFLSFLNTIFNVFFWGREESDTTERLHFHFSLSCFGEGNGNPLQCSCLENPRDREAWWAAVYGVTQSRTRLKWLSSSSSSSIDTLCFIMDF